MPQNARWAPSLRRRSGERIPMSPVRILAIVLIVAGALALVVGSFSYTQDKTAVKLGPMELSVKERKTVDVPVWAGVGAIVVGGLLFVLGGRR
jgi:hypothetical protein